MQRVDGIGGIFFKAADPSTLSQWHATHFGIDPPPQSCEEPVWLYATGPTVFAPFASEDCDNPYLGPTGWGINFRVSYLDAMVAQLRSAQVEVDGEVYPNGRFAQLYDPEGKTIRLWEPCDPEPSA